MARVQYGGIITDIKGSIGGLTFQSNKAAKIVRQRPYSRKNPNASQSARINTFYGIVGKWRELSAANKDAWAVYAANETFVDRWGNTKTLNGYQAFHQLNGNRLLMGRTYNATPPAAVSTISIPTLIYDFRTTSVVVDFDGTLSHPDHELFVYSTYPQRTPAYYDRKLLRLSKIIPPGSTTDFDFFTEYQTVHHVNISAMASGAPICSICSILPVEAATGFPSVFKQNHDYL